MLHGTIRNNDFAMLFAMLEQCCKDLKQCCNNVAMLCWAKNHRGKSSSVTSLLDTLTILKGQLFFF